MINKNIFFYATRLSCLVVILFITSCQKNQVDLIAATAEINRLDSLQRVYHFSKNAQAFVDQFSPDFYSINRGKIEHPGKEKSYERFNSYFESVEFLKWDNVSEPVIRFSEDASLAYMAVDKLVIVKMDHGGATPEIDTSHFAWLTIYKKFGNEWKVDGIASTNK